MIKESKIIYLHCFVWYAVHWAKNKHIVIILELHEKKPFKYC